MIIYGLLGKLRTGGTTVALSGLKGATRATLIFDWSCPGCSRTLEVPEKLHMMYCLV